jgi:hypothetical protein
MAAALARGSRITGAERQELAVQLGQRYAGGESIRAIAEVTGRSFGFVHGLVKESGVTIRGRGGATRGAAATATRAASSSTAQPASETESAAKPPKDKKPAKDKSEKKGSVKGAEAKVKKAKGGKGLKNGKGKSRS